MKALKGLRSRGRFALLTLVVILAGFTLIQSISGEAQSGSALIINAHATALSSAAPNNTNSAAVYVTVQSSTGLVSGLTSNNFTIFAEELAPDGCRVGFPNNNVRSNNPGVYRVDIVPGNSGCTWERGRYVFSVSVNNGSQAGAALAELIFD